MKRFLAGVLFFLCSVQPIFAIYDPVSIPNNRIGVHILDTSEIADAAKLVNSTGGDWGYVTIPLRSDDRDPAKWREFFANCLRLHLIPIIRLATFPGLTGWVEPTSYDLVDFANFLNTMPWPTHNRYVILFNEPNHATEWGSQISPLDYATLILDANSIFKSRSVDFFLLSAGLDMSVPTSATSLDALEYYRRMSAYQPDWYNSVDGLAVHAYPNPGFSASPYSTTRYGITSFTYEEDYLASLGYTGKPIFITETGTVNTGSFYLPAFTQIWTKSNNIVAITPFVLFAGTGDFIRFSLLNPQHQPTSNYQDILAMPKTAGSPQLAVQTPTASSPPVFSSASPETSSPLIDITGFFKSLFTKPSPQAIIGRTTITVEVADTEAKRSQGLSDRSSLPDNSGMLFLFPQSQAYPFWMKDMRFALDFIWINHNRVVELTSNVPPPSSDHSDPVVIFPKESVNRVLEVPAGFISDHGITIGDAVDFRP